MRRSDLGRSGWWLACFGVNIIGLRPSLLSGKATWLLRTPPRTPRNHCYCCTILQATHQSIRSGHGKSAVVPKCSVGHSPTSDLNLNLWIGVNARVVVVAPFARRHLWGICAAVNIGSQCVVARFARRHLLWGICAAVSVGSECVVARFACRHLWCICAAVSVESQCVVARLDRIVIHDDSSAIAPFVPPLHFLFVWRVILYVVPGTGTFFPSCSGFN